MRFDRVIRYRFCYGCGVNRGECGCDPVNVSHNDVYLLNDAYVTDGPVSDGSGRVDVRSCIWRRELRQERELKRDRMRSEESNIGVCTSNRMVALHSHEGRGEHLDDNTATSL